MNKIMEALPSDYHRYCVFKYIHARLNNVNKRWLNFVPVPGMIKTINHRPIDVRLIRDPGVLVRFFPEMRTLGDETCVFNSLKYSLRREIHDIIWTLSEHRRPMDKFEMTNEDMKLYNEIINSIDDIIINCCFWLYVSAQVDKDISWWSVNNARGFDINRYFRRKGITDKDIPYSYFIEAIEGLNDPRIDQLFKQMHARTVKYRDIKETPEYKEVNAGLYIEQLEAMPEKSEYLTMEDMAEEYGCSENTIRYFRNIENWRKHVNHNEFEYTEEFKNEVWDCMQRMSTIEAACTLGVKRRVIHDICYGKLRKASKGLWVLSSDK